MDPITGAVVIAGLKYVVNPSAELVKEFLGRILFPTADATGQVIAHPIVQFQKERAQRAFEIVEGAAMVVEESGGEPQPVPPSVFMPLLEKASLAQDNELKARWVALLANAATNPLNVLPAFVSVLSELSPTEARLLSRVAELHEPTYDQIVALDREVTGKLKTEHVVTLKSILEPLSEAGLATHVGLHGADGLQMLQIMFGNLERLQLVSFGYPPGIKIAVENKLFTGVMAHRDIEISGLPRLTVFGAAFIDACEVDEPELDEPAAAS